MKDCNGCISKSDLGTCQNFKSPNFGKPVSGEKACEVWEIKGIAENE